MHATAVARGSRVFTALGFACGLIIATWASSAHASRSDDERGRDHFQAATSYYEQGRYDEAIREFEAAYELSGRPEMLYNMASAHERLDEFAKAIDALQRYLRDDPNTASRRTVENRIARLQQLRRQSSPSNRPLGSSTSDPGGGIPTGTVVLFAGAGALAAGALVTGLLAESAYQDVEQDCPDRRCPADLHDRLDAGKTLSFASTFLTGAALVTLAGGVVWWAVDATGSTEGETAVGSRRPAASPVAWDVAVTPTRVGVHTAVRF